MIEWSRKFEIFAPRFHASDHLVLHHVSAEGTSRLRVAFAINNNLITKRNSNVVQLSAIIECNSNCNCDAMVHPHGVLEVDATEVEEAQNPRRETEARNRGAK